MKTISAKKTALLIIGLSIIVIGLLALLLYGRDAVNEKTHHGTTPLPTNNENKPYSRQGVSGSFETGGILYETLMEAAENVEENGRIMMCRDVAEIDRERDDYENLLPTIDTDKQFTFDLGGHTMNEALYINSGNVTVQNGSIIGYWRGIWLGDNVSAYLDNLMVSCHNSDESFAIEAGENASVTIRSGTYIGGWGAFLGFYSEENNSNCGVTIREGRFEVASSDAVSALEITESHKISFATGSKAYPADFKYAPTVVVTSEQPDYLAQADKQMYMSLEDAIDNVSPGGKVTLLSDLEALRPLWIYTHKSFTLDLNNHTFSYTTEGWDSAVMVENGDVTIQNGTIVLLNKEPAYQDDVAAVRVKGQYSAVLLENITINSAESAVFTSDEATATIRDGSYTGSQQAFMGNVRLETGSKADQSDFQSRSFVEVIKTDGNALKAGGKKEMSGIDNFNPVKIQDNVRGTVYTSWKEAEEKIGSNGKITLLDDALLNEPLKFSGGKKITLDLGGYTLRSMGTGYAIESEDVDLLLQNGILFSPAGGGIMISGGSTKLDNLTIYSNGADTCAVLAANQAEVTIDSGTYWGYKSAVEAAAEAQVVISGGQFERSHGFRHSSCLVGKDDNIMIAAGSDTTPTSWWAKIVTVQKQ